MTDRPNVCQFCLSYGPGHEEWCPFQISPEGFGMDLMTRNCESCGVLFPRHKGDCALWDQLAEELAKFGGAPLV